jgi:hypothetical protein
MPDFFCDRGQGGGRVGDATCSKVEVECVGGEIEPSFRDRVREREGFSVIGCCKGVGFVVDYSNGVGGGEGERKLESWELELGLSDASSNKFSNPEDESISVSLSSSLDVIPGSGHWELLSKVGSEVCLSKCRWR